MKHWDQKPVSLFFMIAVPKDGGSQHLQILAHTMSNVNGRRYG